MDSLELHYGSEKLRRLVDLADGTHAEQVIARPPTALLTDDAGPYARIRVDPGQTSFFAGREFRTFQKLSITSGGTATIRATVPKDIILFETSLSTEDATIEMQLRVGGTASGPWTAMPVFRKNTMSVSPVIANAVTLDYDGGHTGGTVIDLVRVPSNNKGSAFYGGSSERGVGAGTYYYVLQNVGTQTATIVFAGFWEERA